MPIRINLLAEAKAAEELRRHDPVKRVIFGGALAVALVFVCVQFHPLQTVSLAITKQQRQFHAQLARLDAGLHKLMLNTDGMGYLLTEAN